MPERIALAEVVLRAWLCEEGQKARIGLPAYWATRHTALAADRLHHRHRRFIHDTASAFVPGALGTCADLGLDEPLGNQYADDFDIAGSRALGVPPWRSRGRRPRARPSRRARSAKTPSSRRR